MPAESVPAPPLPEERPFKSRVYVNPDAPDTETVRCCVCRREVSPDGLTAMRLVLRDLTHPFRGYDMVQQGRPMCPEHVAQWLSRQAGDLVRTAERAMRTRAWMGRL